MCAKTKKARTYRRTEADFAYLIGQRFGNLTVLGYAGKRHNGIQNHHYMSVQCDCGRVYDVVVGNLTGSHTSKCFHCASKYCRNYKHGLSRTTEYVAWSSMCQRYKRDGDVCQEWKDSFEKFLGDMGVRPSGLCLCRKDLSVPFQPSNCYWGKQRRRGLGVSRNATVLLDDGTTTTIADCAERLGISRQRVHQRVNQNLVKEALAAGIVRKLHGVSFANGDAKKS